MIIEKNIIIKYHFVGKVVEEGRIMLEKNYTNVNTMDILTNIVNIEKFELFITSIGLLN